MIAHVMDMVAPSKVFHGEAIGVTTLHMAALQEKWLASDLSNRSFSGTPKRPSLLPALLVPSSEKALKIKYAESNKLPQRITNKWHTIHKEIQKIILPRATILQTLQSIQAPTTCGELGWNAAIFAQVCSYSYATRDRFTFLDIEAILGRE